MPLKILPHGVDPERFPLFERERANEEPFTVGTFSTFTSRKGVDVLLAAFRDEFRPHEPARVLLKNRRADPAPTDDPRVAYAGGIVRNDTMLQLLRRMNVFVLPSRGEGFGLTGLEALATGLPLIATNWNGPAHYLDRAVSLPLDHEPRPAGGAPSCIARFF